MGGLEPCSLSQNVAAVSDVARSRQLARTSTDKIDKTAGASVASALDSNSVLANKLRVLDPQSLPSVSSPRPSMPRKPPVLHPASPQKVACLSNLSWALGNYVSYSTYVDTYLPNYDFKLYSTPTQGKRRSLPLQRAALT
eukprot:3264128-Pleurochrysis_carterae.AAC.1